MNFSQLKDCEFFTEQVNGEHVDYFRADPHNMICIVDDGTEEEINSIYHRLGTETVVIRRYRLKKGYNDHLEIGLDDEFTLKVYKVVPVAT